MSTSADLMTTLAWSLLHFFWQGAAIAALAAVAMVIFRESTTRYFIGLFALAAMCASFVVTFALLAGAPVATSQAAAAVASTSADLAPAAPTPGTVTLLYKPAASAPDFTWVARGWLAVVCLLALRLAGGLLLLEHLRRRNLLPLPAEIVERCLALQRWLGISRVVRYCECRLVAVPSVIGFVRPIVLLPVRALTGLSAEQLEAVIAHELGHIKRFDVAVNFIQVVVETLFFFHPAVWWLNKRIRAERENCCDDVAMVACGRNVAYARALALMEDWRAAPELAMAVTGGEVADRVARLLGMNGQRAGVRAAGVFTASLVLAAALTAGAASIGMARPALIASSFAGLQQAVSQAPLADLDAPLVLAQLDTPVAQDRARANRRRDAAEEPRGSSSFIEEMRAVGVDVTDVDLLVALKVHQVSADDVRKIRDAGLDVDTDEIVAMKIHGVTPEYVAEVRAAGLDVDVDEVMAMKIHGVTPQDVGEVRAAGFDVDVDDVLAMKIHGVTPQYVAEIRAAGFDVDIDDVLAMRIHGVSPADVAEVRAAGFDVDVDDVMAMKIHGVTPAYIAELRAAGFDVDVDDALAMKIHGITPEFIEEARARGFDDLDADDLIKLKNADIL